MTLLSRNDFRESVFKRDNYTCINCKCMGTDCHHLIERKLFDNGGYYISNGVTLCPACHILAEETLLSVEELREKANIKEIVLPEHFYTDQSYDKWGNIILPDGKRMKGELFEEEQVQKALKAGDVLDRFIDYVKYPRTYHLSHSIGTSDDKTLENDLQFIGKEVVVSSKMDGENTTLYHTHLHARSLDSGAHESRNWVKGLWGQIAWQIPDGMRICGENMYALHTVAYDDLPSYFLVFSIWYKNRCFSWDETLEYCELLGLKSVPILYRGIYDKEKIQGIFETVKDKHEGYVIRLAGEFNYTDFRKSTGKYVQPTFREALKGSTEHWMSKKVIPNKLKQ